MNNDWYKKGELPHVGDEVEVWVDNVGYWAKVKVLAVDGNRVVWRNGSDGKSYIGTDIESVRPIQTERDKLLDRALEVFKENHPDLGDTMQKTYAENLIDAGWRPVKQQSEDEFADYAKEIWLGILPTHQWRELYRAGCRFVEVQGE